jgi:Pentapeptide repeats (8 copies)
MANEEQLELIKQGTNAWNKWREEHADTRPELIEANLGATNLSGANLTEANLFGAYLFDTDLTGVNLSRANLSAANLSAANLSGANLTEANLFRADLVDTDLSRANLSEANLTYVRLVHTNLENANLSGCRIYGISTWNLRGVPRDQLDLIITNYHEPIVTIDNLEVAQFIYLLLNNQKIRQVIDTITSKVVLIIGRFTKERKRVLDAIREELRKHDYIPVLFDFDKPATKDLHETITTLARMSRFVVADITDAKSIPQELVSIVEQLPSLPVQPILQQDCEAWAMYDHIKRYPWVLELYRYATVDEFTARLREGVISPAEMKVMEIRKKS